MSNESGYHALLQPLLVKEQKLSAELEAVRAAISALRLAADANVPAVRPAPKDTSPDGDNAFTGMSFPEMTSAAIRMEDRALVSREIVEVLAQHRAAENSDTTLAKVQTALNLRADEVGDIAHIGDGKWCLKEWYTERELQDLTSKIDGANARDRVEHRQRTKQGIAALKARGGRIGKKHFVNDYPLRKARANELADRILSGGITGKEFLAEMHKVQPEPQIKTVQSFYNWKAKGFVGLVADAPADEVAKVRLVK